MQSRSWWTARDSPSTTKTAKLARWENTTLQWKRSCPRSSARGAATPAASSIRFSYSPNSTPCGPKRCARRTSKASPLESANRDRDPRMLGRSWTTICPRRWRRSESTKLGEGSSRRPRYALRTLGRPSLREDDVPRPAVRGPSEVRNRRSGRLPFPRPDGIARHDVRRLRRNEGRAVPERDPEGRDHRTRLHLRVSSKNRGQVALLHPAAELGAPVLDPPVLRLRRLRRRHRRVHRHRDRVPAADSTAPEERRRRGLGRLQQDDDRNRHAGLQENASVRQHGREVDRCLPDLQEARVRPAEGFRNPSGATEDLPRLCHVEVRYPPR